MLGQQPDVEGRVLLGGEGVEVAADLVDRLGDGRGRSVGGALEQQVLEEVRRPARLVRLVTGPGPDPEADAHRADVRHPLGGQGQSGREGLGTDHRVTTERIVTRCSRVLNGDGDRPGHLRRHHSGDRRCRPRLAPGRRTPGPAPPRRRPRRRLRRQGPALDSAGRRPRSGRSPGSAWSPRGRFRPPPSPRPSPRPFRLSPPDDATAGASPARERDTLPCGSMSSTRTSTGWPSVEDVLDPLDPLAPADLGDVEQAVPAREGC